MKKKYEHLFFDIDRTLWDFERNSQEAIEELFEGHQMGEKLQVAFSDFLKIYKQKNDELWGLYRLGEVQKNELRQERFNRAFQHFGYSDAKLALKFNDDYVHTSSSKTNLLPHAKEILTYLDGNYRLHVITNGFVEAQNAKLDNCDLRKYFQEIIISDGLGYKKPDKRIFHHAMKKAAAKSANSLMVGDDYGPDVLGAKGVGMDQVYLNEQTNQSNEATYTIRSLAELKEII